MSMPYEILRTENFNWKPYCRLCGAGRLESFNWSYAKKHPSEENSYAYKYSKEDLYIYKFLKNLRIGSLFKCKLCNHLWYLDGEELFINSVPSNKLELIEQWNYSPINLSTEHTQILKEIGRTPPDIYGNGKQYKEFPCKVVTKKGEIFDFAIVVQQKHAPFEGLRNCRLATDIQSIQTSPFALHLEVRIATTKVGEVGMGYAPTFVEKPTGEQMIFNGTQNFYDGKDCLASDIKVAKDNNYNRGYNYYCNAKVTYFVADL